MSAVGLSLACAHPYWLLLLPPHILPNKPRWQSFNLQLPLSYTDIYLPLSNTLITIPTIQGGATSSGPEWKEALLRPVKVCRQVSLFVLFSCQSLSPDLPACLGTCLYSDRSPPCRDGEKRQQWDWWQYSTLWLQSNFRTGC